MPFDLDLIERALDGAVADTAQELAQREVDYAGFADVAKLPVYREAVADAKAARAEFAKLRRAIEVAPHAQLFDDELNGFGITPKHGGSAHAAEKQVRALHALVGHNVLLVKADD